MQLKWIKIIHWKNMDLDTINASVTNFNQKNILKTFAKNTVRVRTNPLISPSWFQ